MSGPSASISNLLTARSSRVPRMPVKRFLIGSDANCFDNYRPRKVVAFNRDYPKNCGRNFDVEVEKSCPITDGTDVLQNGQFSNADCSNAANVEAPIAAVPLRSVTPITLSDMESSDGEIGAGIIEEDAIQCKPENMADVAGSQNMVPGLVEGGSCVDPMTLMDDDEEICILTPEQWNKQTRFADRTCDEAKISIGITDDEPANRNVVKTEENESSDLMGLESWNTRPIQLNVDCAGYEGARASSGGNHLERGTMASEVCESPHKLEQDELLEKCTKDDKLAIVESSCNIDTESNLNRDLINLSIAEHDHPIAVKVRETLELFAKYFVEFLRQPDNTKAKKPHMEAINRLKAENKWAGPEKPFGHIPGIQIGDKFQFRCELVITGLHCEFISGIYSVNLDGKKVATSIVHSGRYKDKGKTGNVLIYSGQGGGHLNQKLEKGNLALANAMEMGYPVRVTYKVKSLESTPSMRTDNCEYIYDGLYHVMKYREEKEKNRTVLKFELHRLSDQARPQQTTQSSTNVLSSMVCVLDDISYGKEKVKIPVLNSVDGDMPSTFSYMTDMVYPKMEETELTGCDCINGCSDLHPCHCLMKNGGEIPYNEEGCILIRKPMVHECGPLCKCPPTCMNRVSQHGVKHQLEIFKTKSMGWGLRSRSCIPSGGFICEYVGEFLQDSEADERSNDQYLFDIYDDDVKKDGFVIDAAAHGNIGRFINHHCSPNVFAQDVLYDHDDKRMPHVMFFAAKKIPALKELSYDYNYHIDKVCDTSTGATKMKSCKCGSRVCTGRLY